MLLRSGVIVAFCTLLSRISGLARELFIAYVFGTSSTADSINVAFKLPNLFRRIFGEGALSLVFIPMFNEKLVHSRNNAKQFAGKIVVLLFLVLTILTIFLQIMMPYLMVIIAPGFFVDEDKFALTVTLSRITMPYVIFVSVIALLGGMLNSVRKFFPFAFVPVILNLCVIFVTYLIKDNYTSHFGVAYSIIIAGILQLIFMYFYIKKSDLQFPLLFSLHDKEVGKLLAKIGPAAMGSGVQQLSLFISQSIASFIPSAISILSYAERLYQLPLSLIGITFSTILLPELSQIYQIKDYKRANSIQNQAIKISSSISIPSMVGLIILSDPIIHVVYERGEFTSGDTLITSQVLSAFAIGLPAFIFSKVLTPIFYANLDTKTPLKITSYSLIVNSILNVILMIPMGVVGIALGSSIAAWFNLWLTNKHAKKYGDFAVEKGVKIFVLQILLISLLMCIILDLVKKQVLYLLYSGFFLVKLTTLMGLIILGILILVISCYALRMNKIFIKTHD